MEITDIWIPNSVNIIEDSAFSYCQNLENVTFEENSLLTTIGNEAFANCKALVNCCIPQGVMAIGERAFDACSSLTSIEIPSGVTSIGERTFDGCRSLTSINIPNSVTFIGDWAFEGCSGLTSINIPNSVTFIGSRAFDGCSNITIYVEAESKPSGWSSIWNYDNRPVVWGYTGD